MKRRKSPVLLLSLLVVLIGAIVVVGMARQGRPDVPVVSQGPTGVPDDSSIGKQISTATHKSTPPGPSGAPSTAPADGEPTISIKKPPISPLKLTPDPNGTTRSEWYR